MHDTAVFTGTFTGQNGAGRGQSRPDTQARRMHSLCSAHNFSAILHPLLRHASLIHSLPLSFLCLSFTASASFRRHHVLCCCSCIPAMTTLHNLLILVLAVAVVALSRAASLPTSPPSPPSSPVHHPWSQLLAVNASTAGLPLTALSESFPFPVVAVCERLHGNSSLVADGWLCAACTDYSSLCQLLCVVVMAIVTKLLHSLRRALLPPAEHAAADVDANDADEADVDAEAQQVV